MEKINYLKEDKQRYSNGRVPYFQYAYRKAQSTKIYPLKVFYLILLRIFRRINCVELPAGLKAGAGLYFGHPYCITINPEVVIGNHVNIHKGVSIGQENRGRRKGVPVIGNNVWIGMNATIVGKICIGDDVLIAPNSFVNCDIPSHSIVLGNPCIIKHSENATYGYL